VKGVFLAGDVKTMRVLLLGSGIDIGFNCLKTIFKFVEPLFGSAHIASKVQKRADGCDDILQ
jgi:hypothetical protein